VSFQTSIPLSLHILQIFVISYGSQLRLMTVAAVILLKFNSVQFISLKPQDGNYIQQYSLNEIWKTFLLNKTSYAYVLKSSSNNQSNSLLQSSSLKAALTVYSLNFPFYILDRHAL
jgi:hypothetical protein